MLLKMQWSTTLLARYGEAVVPVLTNESSRSSNRNKNKCVQEYDNFIDVELNSIKQAVVTSKCPASATLINTPILYVLRPLFCSSIMSILVS